MEQSVSHRKGGSFKLTPPPLCQNSQGSWCRPQTPSGFHPDPQRLAAPVTLRVPHECRGGDFQGRQGGGSPAAGVWG